MAMPTYTRDEIERVLEGDPEEFWAFYRFMQFMWYSRWGYILPMSAFRVMMEAS